MEKGETKKVRIKATGNTINVYQHRPTGDWVDAFDCKTMYKKDELEFI